PEGNDGRGDVHGTGSNHVVQRRGRGCHAAHRGPNDWGHLYVLPPRVDSLSGDLRALERSRNTEACTTGRGAKYVMPTVVYSVIGIFAIHAEANEGGGCLRSGTRPTLVEKARYE